MEVAGRVIEGVLEERGEAREHYDQAIASGGAAIAEEDRPGVFNLRVGNVMPGEVARPSSSSCAAFSPTQTARARFVSRWSLRRGIFPARRCPAPVRATARPSTPMPSPTPRGSVRPCS